MKKQLLLILVRVHIFFTHHDNDHLEGIRFFISKMDQVKEITVPLYQNEITLIARAILNLKGINKSTNIEYIQKFNGQGTRNNLRQIYNNYVKCTHDVGIFLKTCYDNKKMLLAGDVSKIVFNRLIREKKDILAEYLKVPHHGSRHNMNKKILTAINPRIAIISHDNGHFGKLTDTHPNHKILDLLQREHVKVLVTNDVIKNNVLVMKKSTCRSDYINIG